MAVPTARESKVEGKQGAVTVVHTHRYIVVNFGIHSFKQVLTELVLGRGSVEAAHLPLPLRSVVLTVASHASRWVQRETATQITWLIQPWGLLFGRRARPKLTSSFARTDSTCWENNAPFKIPPPTLTFSLKPQAPACSHLWPLTAR